MTDLYERKVFYSKEDAGWIAVATELPGCSAFGKTAQRALEELDTAIELWLETVKSKKWSIPKPLATKAPAGKVLLRLPRELHQDYLSLAANDGISLNQYMLYVLARYRELGHLARHARLNYGEQPFGAAQVVRELSLATEKSARPGKRRAVKSRQPR